MHHHYHHIISHPFHFHFIHAVYIVFFVLVLLVISFYLGRSAQRRSSRRKLSLSKHYFVGLNYLLNEQPDKAVDVFIRMLDVDSETLETHVAIGSLFRRRGEVERAIRIHQNLISKPNLSRAMRIQALIELGHDYLHAGLYDRAERLYLEAIDMGGKVAAPCIKPLLTIYQHEKEWVKAIQYAQLLQAQLKEPMNTIIAHYYCELIGASFLQLTDTKFKEYLALALAADPKCVRVSLIEGEWYMRHNDFKTAIKAYKRVKDQDADYISETVEPLATCYEKLHDETGLHDYLYQYLNESPRLNLILTITDKLQLWHGDKVAADFIVEHLRKQPSIQGLQRLTELYIKQTNAEDQQRWQVLQSLIQDFLRDKMRYQCGHCGFTSKTLDWLCPGCRHWGTIKPQLI